MKKNYLFLALFATLLTAACSADHSCGSCSKEMCSMSQGIDKTPAYFELDSSVLSPEDKDNLDQIATRLKANPKEKVRISGYTDNTGPETYNMELSKRRAMAAAHYLEKQGIATDRIKTMGYGASHFADYNTTDAGRAKNRRVEVSFFQ